jgi:hypothetical protein
VVNFTPRPLYPRGKSPRYPLDRRLGRPQSRSGRSGEEKPLVVDNINTMKQITEALNGTNQDVGLEINTEKTKYLLLSVYQNAGHSHKIMSRDSGTRSGLMFGFIGLLTNS